MSGDVTARNSLASAFSSLYAAATLRIETADNTVLATHTLAGFAAPSNGVLTANAIATETNSNTGEADHAILTDTAGTYTLGVGISSSGQPVIVNNLNYVSGQDSDINSVTITF